MHDYVSPKVGDKVYIQSRCHISRGSDDVHGGVATVKGSRCLSVDLVSVNVPSGVRCSQG